jgi:hypothetical protein
MILLVSGATKYPRSETVGTLVRPGSNNSADALDLAAGRWAMDNGAFGGAFDAGCYMDMLRNFYGRPGCLFVTAPDVIYKSGIGNSAATRRRWPFWSRVIRGIGFPPAFVAQDGLTPEQTPWDDMGALFIGGSDEFKESETVRSLCGYAKARGIWCHWGRVNGKRRFELAQMAGADSIDGTGFSWYSNIRIPMVQAWHEQIQSQPGLGL